MAQDDEALFFGPTLTALKDQHQEVFILCLTNGGFCKRQTARSVLSCTRGMACKAAAEYYLQS